MLLACSLWVLWLGWREICECQELNEWAEAVLCQSEVPFLWKKPEWHMWNICLFIASGTGGGWDAVASWSLSLSV